MTNAKIEQTDELLRAAQQARGTDTVAQLRWHDLKPYGTPCSDRSVPCWADGGWASGWYEPGDGWLDCVTGDRLEGVTHWADPQGPDMADAEARAQAELIEALAAERDQLKGELDCLQTEVEVLAGMKAREAQRLTAKLDALREQKDGAYLERNRCVALIARMAIALGHRVAVTKTAIEGWSEDWQGCIVIELPTGQVSWHFHDSQAHLFEGLPHRPAPWDGHDTPEKYRRVDAAYRFTLPPAADGGA